VRAFAHPTYSRSPARSSCFPHFLLRPELRLTSLHNAKSQAEASSLAMASPAAAVPNWPPTSRVACPCAIAVSTARSIAFAAETKRGSHKDTSWTESMSCVSPAEPVLDPGTDDQESNRCSITSTSRTETSRCRSRPAGQRPPRDPDLTACGISKRNYRPTPRSASSASCAGRPDGAGNRLRPRRRSRPLRFPSEGCFQQCDGASFRH